ncbi:Efflux transporter, RND family [Desulfonema limicola]|uniref:Efflux transporter, RND family n=1 Tax=Desulfonema limicola TaxID=45656 RepID=A0A975B8R8_9BACT|nr:efflux RND transporter periplasmic adaptor subunit [Desulfonema limicola]QTA81064.1 Efflux transporter, RND family [Desulfonema limicola]
MENKNKNNHDNKISDKNKSKIWLRYALLFSVALVIIINGIFFFLSNPSASVNPGDKKAAVKMPLMTVEVTDVIVSSSNNEIKTVGTLLANESVVMRSEVNGRITAIDFNEGEAVSRDMVLFSLDQSVLTAELEKAKANLDLHWADYNRAKSLLKERAISERERDQAFALWKLDKANMQVIQAQLDKTVIRAPFDGTLGLRKVSTGDFINAGQELINIEDTSKLKVEFKIPEIHSSLARPGQKVLLESDAFPGEVFEAEVYAVNPRIDSQARNLELRAVMENRDQKLRPGQFVRVSLEVGTDESALFVPEQALISQPKRQFVWKIEQGSTHMTEVTIGKREKGMVQIVKGLEPGDTVITGGFQKIGEGMQVNAVKADPNMFI